MDGDLVKNFDNYYPDQHEFGITIIQRCGSIANGYSFSGHTSHSVSSIPQQAIKSQAQSLAAPETLNRKRTDAGPALNQNMKPSKDAPKFAINSKEQNQKAQEEKKGKSP